MSLLARHSQQQQELPIPPLSDIEKEIIAQRNAVSRQLEICRSRVNSILLLEYNNKPEDCTLLLGHLAADFRNIVALTKSTKANKNDSTETKSTKNLATPYIDRFSKFAENLSSRTEPAQMELHQVIRDLPECLREGKALLARLKHQLPLRTDSYYQRKCKKLLLQLFPSAIILIAIMTGLIFGVRQYTVNRASLIYFDLFEKEKLDQIKIAGIEGLEPDNSGRSFAWVLGPSAIIAFNSTRERTIILDFLATSPIPNQAIAITANGARLDASCSISDKLSNKDKPCRVAFKAKKGLNAIELSFSDWNLKGSDYFPGEPRALAARFHALHLDVAE